MLNLIPQIDSVIAAATPTKENPVPTLRDNFYVNMLAHLGAARSCAAESAKLLKSRVDEFDAAVAAQADPAITVKPPIPALAPGVTIGQLRAAAEQANKIP